MVLQRLGLGERLEAQYSMARGKAEMNNTCVYATIFAARVNSYLMWTPCYARAAIGPLGWNLLGPLRALMAPEQRSKGAQTFLMQANSRISVDQAKISHIDAQSSLTCESSISFSRKKI